MATRSHPESARIIREARQAAGLTQLELAEKLGVTIGTIGYYERGAGMPKTDNLFALGDTRPPRPAAPRRADSNPCPPRQCFRQRGRCCKKAALFPFPGEGRFHIVIAIAVSESFYIFHRLLPARVSICTQPVLRFG